MQSDHALLDVPVAIACYYPDTVSPRIPSVGVAAGPHIFIYRNLRPHYKFTVPPVPVPQPELDVWEELRSEAQPNVENAVQTLTGMRDEGKTLTSRSLDLTCPDRTYLPKDVEELLLQ